MTEAIIAAVAALLGGTGLKVLEWVLGRSKQKIDFASQLRDELRVDLATLREELQRVEQRLDHHKKMYYSMLHLLNVAKSYLVTAGLSEEAETLDELMQERIYDEDV